jgi:hypothetical protein
MSALPSPNHGVNSSTFVYDFASKVMLTFLMGILPDYQTSRSFSRTLGIQFRIVSVPGSVEMVSLEPRRPTHVGQA